MSLLKFVSSSSPKQLYQTLVKKLSDEGAYHHFPKLWADLQASRFAYAGLELQLQLVLGILDTICGVDLEEKGIENLAPSFIQGWRTRFDHS